MRLVCVECGATDDLAKGWRAFVVPEEADEDWVVAYCPRCAEREFGALRSDVPREGR
jgi:hypothetical protein